MSIQQSFNQMLYSGTIAAGLVAHSPAGQKAAKIRDLKQQEAALQQQYDIESSETEFHPDPDVNLRVHKKFTKELANLKAQQYKLNPTKKAYNSYVKAVDEARALDSSFKDRISFLTGEEREQIKQAKEGGNK